MAYKLKCRRNQPKQRITNYKRCPPGSKGPRNTTAQRNAKRCRTPNRKMVGVDGHKRKVCHSPK
jgi:hypothetical protein